MTKVLVTGAGALLGQGIIRSLKWSRLETSIVAVDPSPLSAGLYWGGSSYIVPMAHEAHYLSEIAKIFEKERPDVLLIGTDVELAVFAEKRTNLESLFNCKILVSSPDLVATADDKYLTFKFLRDHGFSYPETCLPGEEESLIERVGFPLVIKPRVGARSIGMHVVRNLIDLKEVLKTVKNPVIQECVGSDETEYTAGLVCFEGSIKGSIIMRRHLRDGNTYRAFVENDSLMDLELRKICQALDPYGPINLQFRIDKRGKLKIFEINSRFSGTTPLRARAGFNEVEFCIEYILGKKEYFDTKVQQVCILRHWSETVVESKDLLHL